MANIYALFPLSLFRFFHLGCFRDVISLCSQLEMNFTRFTKITVKKIEFFFCEKIQIFVYKQFFHFLFQSGSLVTAAAAAHVKIKERFSSFLPSSLFIYYIMLFNFFYEQLSFFMRTNKLTNLPASHQNDINYKVKKTFSDICIHM